MIDTERGTSEGRTSDGQRGANSSAEDDRDPDSYRNRDSEREAVLPHSESAMHLLLARTNDQVVVDESESSLDLGAIVHERDLGEKRIHLNGPDGESSVVWKEGETVRVRNEGSEEAESVETFRVVDRELGLTPDGWSERERETPVERYREVRVDGEARPAIVAVLAWFASTWGIDEDVGNGAWRRRRDEVLATAYRLDQQHEDGDSFTVETIEREIIEEALAHALERESPFEKQHIGMLEQQLTTPGYREFSR